MNRSLTVAGELERAILETLAYSDVFEYPLRLDEIHRYLPQCAEMEETAKALASLAGQVGEKDGLFFLAGHEGIVDIRKRRETYSRMLLPRALTYGRMLGVLPFVRSVALTGSLAALNCSGGADFDYMLIAAHERVWTARAFALLLNRVARLFGHTLCPNIIVSEKALNWPAHDVYSAHEFCQMIPITGMALHAKLIEANAWIEEALPNAFQSSTLLPRPERIPLLQTLLELPLRGKFGAWIERWEMNRKIARFSRQAGYGEETVFNADLCQGNFSRHRQRTSDTFKSKLNALGIMD